MKIQFIGTGSSINSKRFGASILIENSVLIDTPPAANSILKRENIIFEELSHIFISHLHGDHCFGLPLILMEYGLNKKKSDLSIYGPLLLENMAEKIVSLGFPNEEWELIKKNSKAIFHFIDADIKIDELNILVESFPVRHLGMEAYGFVVQDSKTNLLITADTELFGMLNKKIENCNNIIIDGTTLAPGLKGHISYQEIQQLAVKFPDKLFFVTHRGEYLFEQKQKNIIIPLDGEIVYI